MNVKFPIDLKVQVNSESQWNNSRSFDKMNMFNSFLLKCVNLVNVWQPFRKRHLGISFKTKTLASMLSLTRVEQTLYWKYYNHGSLEGDLYSLTPPICDGLANNNTNIFSATRLRLCRSPISAQSCPIRVFRHHRRPTSCSALQRGRQDDWRTDHCGSNRFSESAKAFIRLLLFVNSFAVWHCVRKLRWHY